MRVSPLFVPLFVLPPLSLFPACAHEGASAPPAAATCPAAWLTPPVLASGLAAPAAGLRVVARVAARGTQNYECTSSSGDAGSAFGWTFVGPEAALADCNAAAVGRHFASEGGAAAPKWEAPDGSFVVAKKLSAEPATEPGAVPWLLLQVTATGGAGVLAGATYVQRTATSGGAMPASGCDATHVGTVAKVPYSADYWFLGR
jgi:hypothetical protein